MMTFMVWMAATIFIPFFAPSLSVLAFGEFMCGIPWGVFQTLSTSYASEVVPTVLRPYVTAYVCMCWGGGILLSSGVVRAVVDVDGDLGWRLPFALQWVWPVPLLLAAYCAPESPWNCVRRGKTEEARRALTRLRSQDTPESSSEQIEAALAYIEYTTQLEKSETENASFADCFRGTNLRRTEINCVVWAAQILCGNAILGYSVVFLEAAGFTEVQAFDLNISLSACYIIGGLVCWLLMPRVGRATLYMTGMTFMFFCLVAIGGLGFDGSERAQLAIGILLVISTLANMTTIGPVCYPIVAETPSGRLRYKTITIGRFVYNVTGIFNNSVTPRMLSSTCKQFSIPPPQGWGVSRITELTYVFQPGTGAPKPAFFTPAPTCCATSGAGSVYLRPRDAHSARSTSCSTIMSPRANSSIPPSTNLLSTGPPSLGRALFLKSMAMSMWTKQSSGSSHLVTAQYKLAHDPFYLRNAPPEALAHGGKRWRFFYVRRPVY